MTIYVVLFVFAGLNVAGMYFHKEILRREAEERLQSQIRTLETAEKRQSELVLLMEAFLHHKGVPISLTQKEVPRDLVKVPRFMDSKPLPPLSTAEQEMNGKAGH